MKFDPLRSRIRRDSAAHDNWQPSPELLAAYFDGECEGRDDLSLLKQRIEDWLAANPGAQEDLADFRHLRQVWQHTTPADPPPEQWAAISQHIHAAANGLTQQRTKRKPWLLRAGFAASIAAAVAGVTFYFSARPAEPTPVASEQPPAVFAPGPPARQADQDEVLAVADASEVTIIRVEAAELPLEGVLELPAPGDVIVTQIRDSDARAVQRVRLIQSPSPMIWAKLDSDED